MALFSVAEPLVWSYSQTARRPACLASGRLCVSETSRRVFLRNLIPLQCAGTVDLFLGEERLQFPMGNRIFLKNTRPDETSVHQPSEQYQTSSYGSLLCTTSRWIPVNAIEPFSASRLRTMESRLKNLSI